MAFEGLFPKCHHCDNPATLAVWGGMNEAKLPACQTCYRIHWPNNTAESLDDILPGRRKAKMQFDSVQDSGAREEFSTGSRRDTQTGKGRPDLIPPYPMERLAKHYENGANKYGDRNWEKGQPLMRYIASAKRHITDIEKGMTDEDHFAAVIWNIMAFMHTQYMIEHFVLPQELDNYKEAVEQYRKAAEFEHLKAVGEELRYKGAYDGLGLISEKRQEELDRVIPATKTEGSEQFISSDDAEKDAIQIGLEKLRKALFMDSESECIQAIYDAEQQYNLGKPFRDLTKKSWK